MAIFVYPAQSVSLGGVATEATLLLVETNTADTVTELQTANTSLTAINSELDTQTTVLGTINTNTSNTSTKLDTTNTQLTAVNSELDAQTTILNLIATNGPLQSTLAALEAKTAASDFTLPYDTLVVTSKSVNGPTQIVSKVGGLAGTVQQTKNIVYDIDGDFESSVVS